MIILDSDVLSDAMRADIALLSWLDRQPATSIWTTTITIFEVRFGLAIMPVGKRRKERQAAFERIIEETLERRVLAFDQLAAEAAAALMEVRHRAGRRKEARDTMIAGIALAHRATLATRNVRHFDDISVPVVDPWQDR
jgi:predicted nucleic acid-binding protein